MNLADIADYVCQKVRHTDDASITRCKNFIKSRFEMIWNDQLWKNSLVQVQVTYDLTLDTTTFPDSKGIKLLPDLIHYVVAVRSADRDLDVTDQEVYFRQSADAFDTTGTPLSFFVTSPMVWEYGKTSPGTLIWSDAADGGTSVHIRYINGDDELIETDVAVPSGGSGVQFADEVKVVETLVKKTTAGSLSFKRNPFLIDADNPDVVVSATSTSATKRLGLQLVIAPNSNVVVRVLGKRRAPLLTNDYDEPRLRGVDQCLQAFAQGDMLEHHRQYAKAREKYSEATALLDQLKRVETTQMANRPRLIPDASLASLYYYDSHSKSQIF